MTMRSLRLALRALVALGGLAPSFAGAQQGRLADTPSARVVRSKYHDVKVETFVELVHPHSIAFTPEGDMLVTERPGRLRIVRAGKLRPDPVAGLPEILALGRGATSQDGREQAGLRDVVLHPRFAENRLLYLSYVKPGANGYGNLAVARGRLTNDRLTDVQEIFHANAPGNGTNRSSMWGGRMVFDGSGFLLVTLGDRQWPSTGDLSKHPAQDLLRHNGTTVRLHDDGSVPQDNPLVGRADALAGIYTWGHRNAQGMAVHPVTGEVWQTEHGPQGGDELNLIRPGLNYGWPVVGYGVNYRTGLAIHDGTMRAGMEPPVHVWVPSIGVSGMLFYSGSSFPEWKDDMFVGGMSGQRLVRLRLEGQKVVEEETLIRGMGRIREVAQGPDGSIYIGIDADVRGTDGPPTPIYRLTPMSRR
jgi:glucose/arabinose dehydrogenase